MTNAIYPSFSTDIDTSPFAALQIGVLLLLLCLMQFFMGLCAFQCAKINKHMQANDSRQS